MQAVCDVLEQLFREGALRHCAIGGATAAGIHGEPLATRDVDVFVFLDPPAGSFLISLSPLYDRLAELGFKEFEEEGLLIHGFPVQFLSASPGLETEAVESAVTLEWDDHQLWVMRPEHLAAIALTVGRPKDRADWSIWWSFRISIASYSPRFCLAMRCKPAGMSGPTHSALIHNFTISNHEHPIRPPLLPVP